MVVHSIPSLNNSRKYNGITFYESDDPHVQRIKLDDTNQFGLYEINFTDDEIHSNETFCRGITKKISGKCIASGGK